MTASLAFDDSPLEGELLLDPGPGGFGWEYEVDFDADGQPEHSGQLDQAIGFAYRFDAPGVHPIRVRLFGRDDTVDREVLVVVNDAAALQVLASTSLPEGASYEGLAIDPSADWLVLSGYADGRLRRVDATTLEVVQDIQYGPWRLGGLSVSPSGRFLFAAVRHNVPRTGRLQLPDLRPLELHSISQEHTSFVLALDDERALFSGVGPGNLARVHLPTGTVEAVLEEHPRGGVPAISPDGTRVAVVSWPPVLYLASTPDLRLVAEYELPESGTDTPVAFHPSGTRVYVLGPRRLFVIELATGEVLRDMVVIGQGRGVSNPVATSRDGRFVVFSTAKGALFIDTTLDLPLYRLPTDDRLGGGSVVASPVEDAVFVADPSGGLRKVRVP